MKESAMKMTIFGDKSISVFSIQTIIRYNLSSKDESIFSRLAPVLSTRGQMRPAL